MAQQTINVGTAPNDGTGTPLRTAFQYTNSNFSELYTAVGPSGNNIVVPGSATITGALTCQSSASFYTGTALPLHIRNSGTSFTQIGDNGTIGAGTAFIVGSSDASLRFQCGGSEQMRLNSTGLGISTSPASALSFPIGTIKAVGMTAAAAHLPGNVSTLKFGINDGGGDFGGVHVFNIHNGTYSSSEIGFFTGEGGVSVPTQRMRIDKVGNVGIGVTPSAWGGGWKVVEFNNGHSFGSAGSQSAITQNAYNNGTNWIYKTTSLASLYQANSGVHYWYNAPSGTAGTAITFTQAMTLDASGNLLVGTTGPLAGNAAKLHLSTNSGTTRWAVGPYSDPNSFIISAVGGSGVYLNGTAATSWTSASDERLKDIIEPISNAIAKVGSLRAVIGKFKFDQNNTRKPFLIAQDIQSVLPEAVDASNPDQLGVAYTDVIPLLVAAIKELTARVQTLETR